MKIIIINGPNLNLTGIREKEIYGHQSFDLLIKSFDKKFKEFMIEYFQSNIEGEIIDKLQECGFTGYTGIILNAGGYTHTSVAIADAIAAIETPVVEVHISNIHAREEYRQTSLTGKNCIGVITGFGMLSYEMAIEYFSKRIQKA
jgi:3-dehydroquinate dehydratase II